MEVAPALAPGTRLGNFLVQSLIGEGAAGEVYEAQDLDLGRRVAIKLIKEQWLGDGGAERFLEEARITAQFNHPNIVTVYAMGKHGHRAYLALELLDGESLRTRMSREPPSVGEALRHVRSIADGLSEAHRRSVIHADLKPENVVIARDGRLRVVDFGLARLDGSGGSVASGTPAYLAPERWRGARPSAAIDVWSLGVIFHELVAGRRPYEDRALALNAFSLPPIELPQALRGMSWAPLLKSCLELAPQERPAAADLSRALSEIIDRANVSSPERSPFRGLEPFSETDAASFHGRERDVDALVERLRHHPLVPIVGPSGVGKSSLLQAGLISRLRETQGCPVMLFRPGPRPLERLAHALLREGQDPAAASALAGRLAEQPGEVVVRLQDRFKAGQPDPLLTIDAFEEVFTLAPPGEASRFGACLAAAALTGRCRVVLTLRDDFLGRLASIEILRSWLGATYVLAPLGKASLELAISEPLRRAGYQAETPALVSRIASDVGDRPGGLPLVQFACAALWERRDRERRVILSSVYDELGGATGALATHAQAFLSQLPASDVRVAREVLLRLVTADGTRRPRLRPDLVSGLPAGAEAMVDRLTAQRLLVVTREPGTDEAYVELAHESLARTWPVLARWIEESTEERSLLQQMEEAARLWDRHGRDAYGTWSEDRAAQIQARVTERGLVLSETALAFLGASLARARRERRVRRLVLGGIIGALGLTTAASAFAAYTFRQRQLVSGDIGRFDLVLQPHDFDPATRRWSPHAGGGPLSWTLAPSTGKHCCDASPPYGDEDLTRGAPAEGADGAWTTRVEAPSRAAVLTVNRSACPPSRIRLDRLPGLGERDHPRSIRIPVPTCEASRAQAIPVPGGPYWAPVDDEGENAAPATRAVLVDVPGFSMDEVEVTNGRYALFEKVFPLTGEQARTRPPTDNPAFTHALEPGYPVIGINFHGAEAFCAWAGMALPVLDEWRKAARGGQYLDGTAKAPNPAERRRTVWAGEAVPGTVVIGRPDLGPAPAGSSGDDRSPYGIKDLAGSLTEWVAPDSRHPLPDGFAFTAGADWAARVDDLRHEIGWAGYRKKTYDDFNSGLRCVER